MSVRDEGGKVERFAKVDCLVVKGVAQHQDFSLPDPGHAALTVRKGVRQRQAAPCPLEPMIVSFRSDWTSQLSLFLMVEVQLQSFFLYLTRRITLVLPRLGTGNVHLDLGNDRPGPEDQMRTKGRAGSSPGLSLSAWWVTVPPKAQMQQESRLHLEIVIPQWTRQVGLVDRPDKGVCSVLRCIKGGGRTRLGSSALPSDSMRADSTWGGRPWGRENATAPDAMRGKRRLGRKGAVAGGAVLPWFWPGGRRERGLWLAGRDGEGVSAHLARGGSCSIFRCLAHLFGIAASIRPARLAIAASLSWDRFGSPASL
ncbi:hypothetical protein THAOC_14845 [Thalassiosira oceanica]|uniref:Uncharacterized protein n=1 Tax=Thalassiosira oceanica TaxID=159749 RepID=K0SHF5_THAOC|nr:hypothetical protein THAOC_14845 [Thalassiosira oceanica]|eukprot:EJK64419.1 hypothetical protein THAOC_14845 [Thalassiosira oceanica]